MIKVNVTKNKKQLTVLNHNCFPGSVSGSLKKKKQDQAVSSFTKNHIFKEKKVLKLLWKICAGHDPVW